jgi:hypothetical protein
MPDERISQEDRTVISKPRTWAFVALAAVLSLFFVSAAFADTPVGTGPDNASGPVAGWLTLGAGQSNWFAFDSAEVASDLTNRQILVRLGADPQGSVGFSVWTSDQARAMLRGDTDARAVGNGTVNSSVDDGSGITTDKFGGDLVWVADSLNATHYIVIVRNPGATAARYMLSITGAYVTFPTPAAAMMVPASSSDTPPALLPETGNSGAPAYSGNGPFKPYAISGQQRQLVSGQQDWYSFSYGGFNSDGSRPAFTLRLHGVPQGSVKFTLWDANGMQGWAKQDPDARSIGQGTLHYEGNGLDAFDMNGGDLLWSGALGSDGTYYVQVERVSPGSGSVGYNLNFAWQ